MKRLRQKLIPRPAWSALAMLTLGGLLAIGLPQAVAAQNDETHTLYSRDTSKDILYGDSGASKFLGVWGDSQGSDTDRIFVSDATADKVHAFSLVESDFGAWKDAQSFSLAEKANTAAGIWSDGETLYVADRRYPNSEVRIVALSLADGSSVDSSSFDLRRFSRDPRGIWSNGTTLWVVDSGDTYVYAVNLDDGTRDTSKGFDLSGTLNQHPRGLWSDETTMWVVDQADRAVAYTLADGARDASNDFDLADGHDDPWGAWSDGTTMWISDTKDLKLYAYHMTGTRAGGA